MKKAIVFLLMTAFLVCPALASESAAENPLDAYEMEVTREATCAESGLVTYTDPVKGSGFTMEIPATGEHDYIVSSQEEPTCIQPGSITYVCTVCGDTYTEEIPATGEHDYRISSEVEPTCAKAGSVTYVCTVCGDAYTEEVPANGMHSYVYQYDAEQKEDKTFASFGTWRCEICGEVTPAEESTAVYYYGLLEEAAPAADTEDELSAKTAGETPAAESDPESGEAAKEASDADASADPRNGLWITIEILAAVLLIAEIVFLILSLRKKQPF